MEKKFERFCKELTPEYANSLCDILLTQAVTDGFVRRINTVEIQKKRKIFKLKEWLRGQDTGKWTSEIDTIEDIGVQAIRDLHGNVDRRVFIFCRTEEASGGSYLCISGRATPPPSDISSDQRRNLKPEDFGQWIEQISPFLVSEYDKLN